MGIYTKYTLRITVLILLIIVPSGVLAQRITFAGMGDIFFGRGGASYGSDDPFRHVKHLFQGRDIVYGNLETPICKKRVRMLKKPCSKKRNNCETEEQHRYRRLFYLTFQARVDAAKILKQAGFTVMGTSNNHAEDQKASGILETLDHLRANNLAAVGTGPSPADAWQPFIFEKNGVKIGLIAATAVWNFDPTGAGAFYAASAPPEIYEKLPAKVEELKPKVDFVIVAVHIGAESSNITPRSERRLTTALAKAGADLFVGTHPHVLRGVEVIGSMVAVWSLGNFLFDSSKGPWGESAVLQVDFVKDGKKKIMENIYLHPITLDGAPAKIPRPAKSRKAKKILRDLIKFSRPFNNSPDEVVKKDGKIKINPAAGG